MASIFFHVNNNTTYQSISRQAYLNLPVSSSNTAYSPKWKDINMEMNDFNVLEIKNNFFIDIITNNIAKYELKK